MDQGKKASLTVGHSQLCLSFMSSFTIEQLPQGAQKAAV